MEDALANAKSDDDEEDDDDEEAADMEAFEESGMLDNDQVCKIRLSLYSRINGYIKQANLRF